MYAALENEFRFQEKYTGQLLKEMKPMLNVDLEPPYPVAINTYNLIKGNVLKALGFPVLHSAVEILGREFAFGGHQFDETGVYCCKPRSLAGASFIEQIYVEHCFMSKEQVGAVIL